MTTTIAPKDGLSISQTCVIQNQTRKSTENFNATTEVGGGARVVYDDDDDNGQDDDDDDSSDDGEKEESLTAILFPLPLKFKLPSPPTSSSSASLITTLSSSSTLAISPPPPPPPAAAAAAAVIAARVPTVAVITAGIAADVADAVYVNMSVPC
ncbi:actin cytoskeleton-regulatory complex protein pan1-like [Octopus sinensis]|uniref:Actin cytoskeleton-regulatory complex protein pan1-like n=1 Tax=Octopus sinensis TaxID=2607531 RepID=A0A7E6FS58_9MOLL|nr:actin cytoskeleton-regulatory complex protein pan1-like [Octopus sinensis]